MTFPTMLRALGCLAFGHAPTVQALAGESKADYICGRCGAVLGVFVADTALRRAEPIDDATSCRPAAAITDGPGVIPVAVGRTSRPAVDREPDLRESTRPDDGDRVGVPAAASASSGNPGRPSARLADGCFLIGGHEH
jgi:hypothetical protein